MGYHHPRQTNPYLQGNVQGGQPQDTGYNNQRTPRSHSQSSVQTGGNPTVSPTLSRSLSNNRPPISGQAQPFEAYGTGQNREPGLPYVPPTNTPQYAGAQGQIRSPSYQDPSQAYQSEYFPAEGQPPHVVPQQNRTHQSPPRQPSVTRNPPHSVQGQYPQHEHGNVDYSAGHLQQRRPSSSQYPPQQQQQQQQQQHERRPSSSQYPHQQQQRSSSSQYLQQQQQQQRSSPSQYPQQHQHPQRSPSSQYPPQQQPSTQVHSQQPQSSPPQYHQQHQQPSSTLATQPYSQHQQSSPTQQYQASSQQYTQQQHSPPLRQQGNFTTAPGSAVSSFGSNVPGGIYETPREETRQSRSAHRGSNPICRLTNCPNSVIRDEATQELTEYCSLDHMQEVKRRGAPLCPACNKCPRRLDGRYCGSSCEKHDRERQRQPRQQQQQHPRPPAGVRPTPPPSRSETWDTTPGGSSSVHNFHLDKQRPLPGGELVHCPQCNSTYSAQGRNPRTASLPPCPTCGFCR